MQWTKPLSKDDMISVLHEQGELQTFNPSSLYKVEAPKIEKKSLKKADQIRLDNIKQIEEKQIKLENEKIKSIVRNLNHRDRPLSLKEIGEYLSSINFESNKFEVLLEFLNFSLRISDKKMVCDLFLVVYDNYKKFGKILPPILKKANEFITHHEIDLVEHQMKISPQFMPPLSPFENHPKKLEEWQLKVLSMIDENKSVLIVAPTSSGKTACMNYVPTKVSGKVLYIVPSNELAKQVAGMYRRSLKGGVALITNKERFFENDNWRVLVGTPHQLENYLVYNKTDFDYAVYDEIQKLNPDSYDYFHEGAAYERLIKMVKCPFLVLTATIENPQKLGNWLSTISGNKIEVVIHKTRPIIQQLHEYNNGSLTPISRFDAVCNDDNFVASPDFLELPLTADDIYRIYEDNEDNLEDIDINENLGKRITLDDLNEYRVKLLSKLQTIKFKKNIKLPNLTNNYSPDNFVTLFNGLKTRNILPAILFKLDEVEAIQLYEKIIDYLGEEQEKVYPHHQEDLFWIAEQRKMLDEKVASIDKIKIPEGETDPVGWIQAQKERVESDGFSVVKSNYTKLMEKHITEAKTTKEKLYYRKQLSQFLELDSFPNINPYAPHEEFIFHNYPLSEGTARDIRRKLIDNLRAVSGKDVDFNKFSFKHMFLRGILRGIVLYTRSMPAPFQHVVQSLVALGKAPVIISDDSLAYGVNFPIKTTIICGSPSSSSLDIVKAHQMMGRSGRRGIDREGHVVFMGVDWVKILREQYSPIIGDISLGWYSRLPSTFLPVFDSDCLIKPQTLRETMLGVDEKQLRTEAQMYSQMVNMDEEQGLWNLRWCEEIKNVGLGQLEHNFRMDTPNETFKYLATLLNCNQLQDVIQSFIHNGVISSDPVVINELKRVGDFLISLYPYTKNKKAVEEIFNKIKAMWEKHQL